MTNDERLYRVIDANLNRLKEGLRVVEDVRRYGFDDLALAKNPAKRILKISRRRKRRAKTEPKRRANPPKFGRFTNRQHQTRARKRKGFRGVF